jgi:hypothetical protein
VSAPVTGSVGVGVGSPVVGSGGVAVGVGVTSVPTGRPLHAVSSNVNRPKRVIFMAAPPSTPPFVAPLDYYFQSYVFMTIDRFFA